MKKIMAFLLAAVTLLSFACVSAGAEEPETLTVNTRGGSYTFEMGEVFTYSFWVSMQPDLANYVEEYVSGDTLELIRSELDQMKLKSILGSVKFDKEYLTLLSADMPELKLGLCYEDGDELAGTILEDTIFDFADGDLIFYGKPITAKEKKLYQEKNVLVTCIFRVIKASETPVYLRTKLHHFEITVPSIKNRGELTEINYVKGEAHFPYESFETVNNEPPTIVLKSLVDDVGLDVRYLETPDLDRDNFLRPGAGVKITLQGMAYDGRWINLETVSSGAVVWFYDVPYGQYYASCAFTDEKGRYYATPDPEKAEHINVPATAAVQALWLIRAEPEEAKSIDVYISWEGDDGYLPVRPEYLYIELLANKSFSSVENRRLVDRLTEHISFDYADVTALTGEEIDYTINVSAEGSGAVPYSFYTERELRDDGGINFTVHAVYRGLASDLHVLPEEYGHYWEKKESLSEPATCTRDGSNYYLCAVCHQPKVETVPALGHLWNEKDYDGELGRIVRCSRCGTVKPDREAEEALKNFVERLYKVCLERDPDSSETEYYVWSLTSQGLSGTEAAACFVFSDEFSIKNYCDTHFAEALYRIMMGREPGAEETAYWAWRLQQGGSREQIFGEFAQSREFSEICAEAGIVRGDSAALKSSVRQGGYCTVPCCTAHEGICAFASQLYEACFDRSPRQDELDAWHYFLVHGDYTGSSAAAAFVFSDEFLSCEYDDAEFTRRLYAATVGREPDGAEQEYWCRMLASGTGREEMFASFIHSEEYRLLCQQYGVIW